MTQGTGLLTNSCMWIVEDLIVVCPIFLYRGSTDLTFMNHYSCTVGFEGVSMNLEGGVHLQCSGQIRPRAEDAHAEGGLWGRGG